MTGKPLTPRREASEDLRQAIDNYGAEAGERIAVGFADAVEATLARIARRPGLGSPRHGQQLRLPGLRTQAIRRYPYLVFYVEFEDRIEVWRVLHMRRDIAALLREAEH